MELMIRLARDGQCGLYAILETEEMDEVEICSIVAGKPSTVVPVICAKAAADLRVLARAFEFLAESEQPFTEEAQQQALGTAVREASLAARAAREARKKAQSLG